LLVERQYHTGNRKAVQSEEIKQAQSANKGGLREQKKRDTRSRLCAAALSLFATRGYDETSMEEIAARAGVSRRTCFRYFPSKEALAFPHREERLARFKALMEQGPRGETGFEAVKRACLAMAGAFMAERDEMVVLEKLIRSHPTLRARERENDRDWEHVIVATLSRETDARSARLIAGAAMGLIRAGFELWLESDGKLNLIEIAQKSFVLMDNGVPGLLERRV
jgi:AcrR family transcriptional regulator